VDVSRRSFLGLLASLFSAACGSGAGSERAAEKAASAKETPAATPPASTPVATPKPPGPVKLSYLTGSSVKIEQIIGEYDRQTKKPTLNLTESRFGVIGTDLGYSFEHAGQLYFLFGDAMIRGGTDPMGFTTATDPNAPMAMQILSDKAGTFIPIRAPGISMNAFEVPTAGISVDGIAYVSVITNYTAEKDVYKALLMRFDERAKSFAAVRELSHLPGGHFIKLALHASPPELSGLPEAGPHVLMFGCDEYRKSHPYLAVVPNASFAGGQGTRYFAGLSNGEPRWSDKESACVPVFNHPTIGDMSVAFVQQLGLWLMLYDSREPRGILLRYATKPWGPWSEPVIVFESARDKARGVFIHDPSLVLDDGLGGPVAGDADPLAVAGASYGPYMIERFTRVADDKLTIHYLLSLWNPYTIVRMKSTLTISR